MSTGKTEEEAKNKRRSLLKHRKCFKKREAGETVKNYGQKMNQWVYDGLLLPIKKLRC
jgi:hypothetical protein